MEEPKAPGSLRAGWRPPRRVISSSSESEISDDDFVGETTTSNSHQAEINLQSKKISFAEKNRPLEKQPIQPPPSVQARSSISSKRDISSSDDDDDDDENDSEDLSSSDDEENESSTNPQSLDFPLSKLCFIFEKMGQQPASVDIITHGSRLIRTNSEKLHQAPQTTVAVLATVLTRKEILEEAMLKPTVCTDLCSALLVLADSVDYLMPIEMYHFLLQELDLGSYHDYPGLLNLLKTFSLIQKPLPSSTLCTSTLTNHNTDEDNFVSTEKIEERRLTLMTMTYALLELWPGSLPLGTSLFKAILSKKHPPARRDSVVTSDPMLQSQETQQHAQAQKRAMVFSVVNLILRVCAGDAKNAPINVSLATRLMGNLVNVSESATQQALRAELNHLVAFYAQPLSPAQKRVSGGKRSVVGRLPGQVAAFLTHLAALTYSRQDCRLNVVRMLSGVIQDHILAFDKQQAHKLAIPILQLCFSLSPFEAAVDMASNVMCNSTNSHLRFSTLAALVDVWGAKVHAAASQGLHPDKDINSDEDSDAVATAAVSATSKTAMKALWDLIINFMEQDPVEKVRLYCLDAVETIASHLTALESATAKHMASNAVSTALTEASVQLSPSRTTIDTDNDERDSKSVDVVSISNKLVSSTLSILGILPENVLISLVVRCGDVSPKVQVRAVELLRLGDPASDNVEGSDRDVEVVGADNEELEPRSSAADLRPCLLETLDRKEDSERALTEISEILLGLEVAAGNAISSSKGNLQGKKGRSEAGTFDAAAMKRLTPLFRGVELQYTPSLVTPKQQPNAYGQEVLQCKDYNGKTEVSSQHFSHQQQLDFLEEPVDEDLDPGSQKRTKVAPSSQPSNKRSVEAFEGATYNSIMFD